MLFDDLTNQHMSKSMCKVFKLEFDKKIQLLGNCCLSSEKNYVRKLFYCPTEPSKI